MKLKPQFRSVEIGEFDGDSRSIVLSFSSKEPYERAWGIEILDHSAEAVDMTRLERAAPLLFNHDLDKHCGVVERAWIDGAKGYAQVRFGESEFAEEIFKDVSSGVLRNVSVGYQIQEMVKEGEAEGVETYRVTKWMPFEISIVTIPADTTVGFGRAALQEAREVSIITDEEPEMKVKTTDQNTDQNTVQDKEPVDVRAIENQAREAERKRVAEIQAIGERFGLSDLTRQFIENGKGADEFRAAVLEKLDAKPVVSTVGGDGEIGMSEKEARQFSLVRAINALASPSNRRAQDAAKFEFEVSEEAQRKAGVEARGILVPFDVLNRALTVTGTGSTGSNVVATDLLAGDFIGLLRNRSAVLQRANIMSGLSGNVAIPRQNAATTPQALAETAATTASDIGLDQVAMSPRRVGAQSSYSKQLLAQESVDVENLIRNDLLTQIALHIDLAALAGDGTGSNPVGLLNAAGVNLVSIGTNGGAPTWSHIVQMESAIAQANADVDSMSYIINAKTNGYLKTTPKEAGMPVYLVENGVMNGYAVGVSNQLPSNLTKGTGTGLSALAFGNWNDLLIGFWGGIDLVVDPYTQKGSGLIEVQADQFYDVALRHPESFAVIKDALV